jgi:hypothetical protein
MTLVRARITILVVFLASLLIQYFAVVSAFLKSRIYSDELSDLTWALIQVYSIPLAIVIGGIFSAFSARNNSATKITRRHHFWIAFVLVLIWNLFLIWRSTAFGFLGVGTVTDLARHINQVSTYYSWLLAGCLAFYFSKK